MLGVLSKLQGAYAFLAALVSGLSRARFFNRVAVVFGLLSDVIISVLESTATLNPVTWIVETGKVFFNLNGQIISNISTLQTGVSGWRAVQISLAIWGYLFVIYFSIKFFAYIAEETFAGDNSPTLPLYLFIAMFVVAPTQVIAGLTTKGLSGEELSITKEIIPYSGVYEVLTNIDLWLNPIVQVIPDLGVFGMEGNSSNGTQVIK